MKNKKKKLDLEIMELEAKIAPQEIIQEGKSGNCGSPDPNPNDSLVTESHGAEC